MKDIIKPYPFTGDESEVFGKIVNVNFENLSDESNIIKITLVNKKMLEYDELVFSTPWSSEKKLSSYKPYFYEFEATTHNIKEIYKEYTRGEEWLCIKLYESSPNEKIEGTIIHGEILFSASPIERRNVTLVITDKRAPIGLNDKIKLIYGIKENIYSHVSKDINAISSMTNYVLPYTINKLKTIVYNVGQANNSYLSINRNYGIFFDIGYTLSESSTHTDEMVKAIDKYKLKRPRIIILSHWDLDHIIGLVYAQDNIYNSLWIAPNIDELPENEKSLSACRVCKYLNWRKANLILVDSTFNDKIVFQTSDKMIRIFKGKGGKGYTLNNNNFGLLLEVNGHKKMLFTGDVEYSKMPNHVIGKSYDYIIAPHHAGYIGSPNIHAYETIISVGQNKHKHPSLHHLRYLYRSGSKIIFTCQFSSWEQDL